MDGASGAVVLSERLYMAALVSPFVILAIQVVLWLNSAEWVPLPLGESLFWLIPGAGDPDSWLNDPQVWLGAHKLFMTVIDRLPLHVGVAVMLALFGVIAQVGEAVLSEIWQLLWGNRRKRRIRPQF
jgi:hypothetical protein